MAAAEIGHEGDELDRGQPEHTQELDAETLGRHESSNETRTASLPLTRRSARASASSNRSSGKDSPRSSFVGTFPSLISMQASARSTPAPGTTAMLRSGSWLMSKPSSGRVFMPAATTV